MMSNTTTQAEKQANYEDYKRMLASKGLHKSVDHVNLSDQMNRLANNNGINNILLGQIRIAYKRKHENLFLVTSAADEVYSGFQYYVTLESLVKTHVKNLITEGDKLFLMFDNGIVEITKSHHQQGGGLNKSLFNAFFTLNGERHDLTVKDRHHRTAVMIITLEIVNLLNLKY